jgi:hypothetical protein
VAGGLLYLHVRVGRTSRHAPAGHEHWNSTIFTNGRIALPEGDANDHRLTGILNIYRLP